jgi:uncharacterized iron-regulated membrane protein
MLWLFFSRHAISGTARTVPAIRSYHDTFDTVMKALRTLVFWLHLCTGVTVGIVVLIMSVTGCCSPTRSRLTRWANTRSLDGRRRPPPRPSRRRHARRPRTRRVAGHAHRHHLARRRRRAGGSRLRPRAHALSQRLHRRGAREGSAGTRRFFRVVTDWHRWLGREGPRRALGKS